MADEISGQLGSAALGNWGLGWPGTLSAPQARINSFTASSLGPVAAGTAITLTWATSFATLVTISGVGTVAASGSTVVNPSGTTTYTLTATDGVNPPQSQSLTVLVAATATFVRAAKAGPTFNSTINLSMQLDLGDLVVVCAGNGVPIFTNTQDMHVSDNLGNAYSVAIQGRQLPPDAANAQDAQIAYTFVTHPGVATITMTCTVTTALILLASEYTTPSGMVLAQTAHQIGGVFSIPNQQDALGTSPVNLANTLLITFGRHGGVCLTASSLDGDTRRVETTGCSIAETTMGAIFDAMLVGPGARGSNIDFSVFFPGTDECGGVCPGPPFYGIAGTAGNVLVAAFSAPLQRPAGLTSQAAVLPGLSSGVAGYPGQPVVPVALPFLPIIGSVVFVGCNTDFIFGNPIPTFTPTDNYGNIYTPVPGAAYHGTTLGSSDLFYTIVTAVPTAGPFIVDVTTNNDISSAKSMAVAEYFLNALNPATFQAAIRAGQTNGAGLSTFFTTNVTVAGRSLIAGFGATGRSTGTPTPWTPAGGFAIDTSWDLGQVSTTPLPNAVDMGTGDWFHQYVPSAGTYQGQTTTTTAASGAIIVVAVPAPPAGAGLTLACPIGGGTATVGVFYSASMVPSGGSPPYSNFHVISGSLPPGLSLDRGSGVISGTPTTAGFYTFTIECSDSSGGTARITCSILVSAPIPATGACRTTLNLWQHSVSPQVETITDRNDDWNNSGTPHNKFYQGLRLDADTFGVDKLIAIRDADTGTLHALQPSPINHAGRQTKPYSFAVPFNAHTVRRESQDMVPYRQFGIEYVWEATPEFTYTWATQRTNHGLKGFHHVQQIIMTYASNAPVTLTIGGFDGTPPQPVMLASTGGVFEKVVVILTFNKQMLYDYSLTSTTSSPSGAFQVWKNQLEIRCGDWGRIGDYINYNLIGGNSGDEASI